MKKLSLLLTGVAMIALTGSAFGQRRGGGSFDLQLNLAPIAVNNFSLFAGYNFEKDMTAGGVVGYQNLSLETTTFDSNGSLTTSEISYSGFYIAPEFRFYFDPSREGNDGWYAGGYLKYRNFGTSGEAYTYYDSVNDEFIGYDRSSNGMALGIVSGRMWTTRIGLTFGTWAGLGYYLFDVESTSVDLPEDNTIDLESNLPALDFRLGINVGYRF